VNEKDPGGGMTWRLCDLRLGEDQGELYLPNNS